MSEPLFVANNYAAPDGFRYGVMFNDGSVMTVWNGRTQRQRAEEAARECATRWKRDRIVAVRKVVAGPWQEYDHG